jgi:hypothetical protein
VSIEAVSDLAEVVNAACNPCPDPEVKRSVSKSSLSPKRKKQKLFPTTDDNDVAASNDVDEWVDRLEVYAEKLFEAAVAADESFLSEEHSRRLVALRQKLSALLPPQYSDDFDIET